LIFYLKWFDFKNGSRAPASRFSKKRRFLLAIVHLSPQAKHDGVINPSRKTWMFDWDVQLNVRLDLMFDSILGLIEYTTFCSNDSFVPLDDVRLG
jgi:hypothetical protein